MSRRRAKHEPHVRLYRHELECEAYRSLSTDARALLIEFRALYNGTDNRVHMSVREMMRRANLGQRPAQSARDELLDRGFIRLVTDSAFTRKTRRSPEYVLTNEQLNGQSVTPKDFLRWHQKNTVVAATTDCSGCDYSNEAQKGKKPPDCSGSDYSKGPKPPTDCSGSHYTDSVPGGGTNNGLPDWLLEHGGWPVMRRPKIGEPKKVVDVLSACCLVCGVWTTADRREFDDSKHSCDPVSRAKHCERLQAAQEHDPA